MSKHKVPIQKGEFELNTPYYRNSTNAQKQKQDAENMEKRRDGTLLRKHEPRK